MSRKFSVLLSLGCGLLLSAASVLVAFNTLSSKGSKILAILLWNFYLTSFLIEKNLLSICSNCELLTFLQFCFYGFIVGIIGYSIVIFGFFWLLNKLQRRKTIDD